MLECMVSPTQRGFLRLMQSPKAHDPTHALTWAQLAYSYICETVNLCAVRVATLVVPCSREPVARRPRRCANFVTHPVPTRAPGAWALSSRDVCLPTYMRLHTTVVPDYDTSSGLRAWGVSL